MPCPVYTGPLPLKRSKSTGRIETKQENSQINKITYLFITSRAVDKQVTGAGERAALDAELRKDISEEVA